MKTCSKCRVSKPLDEFHRNSRSGDGRHAYCKACNNAAAAAWDSKNAEKRRTRLRVTSKTYFELRPGLATLTARNTDLYQGLYEAQDGACAVCGGDDKRRLSVDHDHSCCEGRTSCGLCVRGLVCSGCNIRIYHFEQGNNVKRYRDEIAAYLDRYDVKVAA